MGFQLESFSPVAGIQWVETFFFRLCDHGGVLRFSPVAGIQWVETSIPGSLHSYPAPVSVPLPGFSGLRHLLFVHTAVGTGCFSPVAGIQWVETQATQGARLQGIAVSVPLPGFSGLRLQCLFIL